MPQSLAPEHQVGGLRLGRHWYLLWLMRSRSAPQDPLMLAAGQGQRTGLDLAVAYKPSKVGLNPNLLDMCFDCRLDLLWRQVLVLAGDLDTMDDLLVGHGMPKYGANGGHLVPPLLLER